MSAFCIGQSLLFIYLARSVADGGVDWWVYFGSKSITGYQLISAVFLELNVAIQLSIFSARTEGVLFFVSLLFFSHPLKKGPFWIRRPGTWVLVGVFFGCLTATLIAALWTITASFQLGDGALMVTFSFSFTVCC